MLSAFTWLIVGLGNPDAEYAWTPHNMGFLALDCIAARHGIRVTRAEAESYVGIGSVAGREVVLAKPQTYMNASGRAVEKLVERQECAMEQLLVLSDEIALPWGMLRIGERGSAGGHNGLKSVIAAVGTENFPRLRLGVKPDYEVGDLAAYVLSRMGRAERETAMQMASDAADAVEVIVADGLGTAMARFNRRVPPEEETVG
jgi:PTH1 family peptidyl-tRNA hydrolase